MPCGAEPAEEHPGGVQKARRRVTLDRSFQRKGRRLQGTPGAIPAAREPGETQEAGSEWALSPRRTTALLRHALKPPSSKVT